MHFDFDFDLVSSSGAALTEGGLTRCGFPFRLVFDSRRALRCQENLSWEIQ